ncbi:MULTISPECIES: hypothetical protein [unclassified Pseudoalteromonas]|uniref:hypothetical protein n=1 Tax=unclassified Pseudoalteromonas TaxID=194690 RepID=UPI0020972C8B|nr:hypothetical protein [Pseudoalteromonas sp. XMcav2-N]MCO7186880.1 hypothetical protein [Pseudoalteromonas sp. XMcav2-N]
MKKIILIPMALTVLAGCYSTPKAHNDMVRLNSSEVNEEALKLELAFGKASTHVMPHEGGMDADSESKGLNSAKLSLGYGLELDAIIASDTSFGIKYQFYGKHREHAQSGDWSHAVRFGFVTNKDHGTTSRENTYRHWGLDKQLLDVSFISGYRISPQFLAYGSVFYQTGDMEIIYCAEREGCNADVANKVLDYDGHNYGLSLAIEHAFSPSWYGTLETVYHHSSWFDRSNTEMGINVSLAYRF